MIFKLRKKVEIFKMQESGRSTLFIMLKNYSQILSRRDKMLQQMGITQWELVRPDSLRGIVNMPIAENIRLIIIAETALDKNNQFIQDVLSTLRIATQDCLSLSFDFTNNLNLRHRTIFWFLGIEEIQIATIQKAFSENIFWKTPDLEELQKSVTAKKLLWQQMQQGE